MAVTDLTGTTWLLSPSTDAYIDTTTKFNLTGTCPYYDIYDEAEGIMDFEALKITSGSAEVCYFASVFVVKYPYQTCTFRTSGNWRLYHYTANGDEGSYITTESPILVHISGGTDVTNSKLIEWFETHGTMLEEERPTKKFTRLYLGDIVASSGGKCFRRLTTQEPILAAGLYDADDNLVASWDTLVNTYGMDCEKDYDGGFAYDTASPFYVLTNKSTLSSGTKLIIGDSVTSIGDRAFHSCKSLTSIVIPDSVTSIGVGVFAGCDGLTSVVIPDNVASIRNLTFFSCDGLTSVVIPDSVISIGYEALYDCDNLTDVYYKGTVEQWAGISIDTTNTSLANATIHYNYTG